MPIFASSLGLLEPVKLKTAQENEPKEHITNHVNGKEPASKADGSSDKNCGAPDSIRPATLNQSQLIDDLGGFDALNQNGKR